MKISLFQYLSKTVLRRPFLDCFTCLDIVSEACANSKKSIMARDHTMMMMLSIYIIPWPGMALRVSQKHQNTFSKS